MLDQLIIVITLLLFLLVALGKKFSGSYATIKEFTIGRTKLDAFPMATGLSMSFVGGASTLNLSSLGYQYGWIILIDPLAVFLAFCISVVVADKVRLGSGITISDMLVGASPALRLVLGLTSFMVYQLFAAAQFVALGKLLSPIFPSLPVWLVIIVPAFMVMLYVCLRGFESVTKTDVFQFSLIVVLFALPAVWIIMFAAPPLPHTAPAMIKFTDPTTTLLAYLAIPLLFVPVSQDTNIRVKSARSLHTARLGLLWGGFFYASLVATSVAIGVFMNVNGVHIDAPETTLIKFFDYYFGAFSILATIAIMAAIISTLDSFGFDAVVTLSNDLSLKFNRFNLKEKHIIGLATAIVFCLSVIIALAYQQILALILTALLLYVAVFIPVAIGRYLKLDDDALFVTSLTTIILIICFKTIGYKPMIEPLFYVLFHVLLVAVATIIRIIKI